MGRRVPLLLVAAVLLGGCAPPGVEPYTEDGKVWPASPEPPRVRFVTEFTRPADLGIRPSVWSRVVGLAAGSGEEGMQRPMAVVASPDGQLIFVADPDAQCVHRFDRRRGRYDCLAAAKDTAMVSPIGLALAADGRLFVADSATNQILVAAPDGKSLSGVDLSPPPERPTGLALGPAGELFVASTASHSVRRYDAAGRLVREYGGRGSGTGQMNYPTYLWLTPPAELLVTDTMNFRIQRIDAEDGVLGVFGQAGNVSGSLARPKGVAMDRHGHIYVVDGMHHAMQIFDRDGQLLLAVGEQGRDPGQFWLPSGVYATAEDLIFVADAFNRRVQVFRYVGEGS